MMRVEKCSYCGALFIKKSNAQKLCSQHCRHESQLESKRKYSNKRNLEKHYNTRRVNLTTLGSLGTISSSHRNPNEKEETRIIKSQLKRIRWQ